MKSTEIDQYPVRRFGITLSESILVALLLVACAIGIGLLLTQAKNILGGEKLHTQAVQLANEMAEQIKNETNQNYESTLGASCDGKTKQATTTSNKVACWQDKVQQQLSNGSSKIYLDRTMQPAQYVIIVSWSEPSTVTASYILRVKLKNAIRESDAVPAVN
jgi:hypothetical protein